MDDWSDYLVRSEAALLVPLVDWLKLKFAISDTYDSTPAEEDDPRTPDPDDTDEVQKNTFVSTIGIAATY